MDMRRVTACSIPLRDRSWEKALDAIGAAGFERIDLLGRLPHLSLDPSECDPSAIKRGAEARGLEIANLGTYVGAGFASPDLAVREQELDHLTRAIDVAVLFGARSIRVRPGDDDPRQIARIAPLFERAAAYAAERDIYMGFETHGGGISGSPDQCVALCREVGSPYFGVLYDPCNLMHDGTDYRMALWTMRDHITHVHLKDGAVTGAGFGLTMFGEGQLDFCWIVEQLDAWGYGGDLAAEYELKDEPPESGLRRWFAAMQAL